MLSLTHHGKKPQMSSTEQNGFSPIVISNKLPKETSPKKQQKAIIRANYTNFVGKVNQMSKPKPKTKSQQKRSQSNKDTQQVGWYEGGAVRGTFDKKLQKDQLAAEERRLRAEIKKEKELNQQEIIINEKKIARKGIKMTLDKDQEIQYLQRMIDKEKEEKNKIDMVYERKKMQIERERQELIELERRIQREGIKEKQVVKQVMNIATRQQQIPSNPQTRKQTNIQQSYSHQVARSPQNTNQRQGGYEQPTQSQILHQKNSLRQQQLEYLMDQREKCLQKLPNINYTPTLIPLLSKASYKIVSTHVSQIVQLLVDELLEEQVYVLEEIELQEQREKQIKKEQEALNEYYDLVDDFAQQNEQIANRVGNYASMEFTDVYKPKHYPKNTIGSGFEYEDQKAKPKVKQLALNFEEDRMEEVQNRKDKFCRFVSNFDEYKKNNMKMFQACTQELIDQAILKLANQLDKGSGQFVNIVFRNEFN